MPKQPKPRPVGRPKLASHEAKARIVPVRFSAGDIKKIEAAAKARGQTVSHWIRTALAEAVNG
jgi:predicted DNA binding CopG/RHH family protein